MKLVSALPLLALPLELPSRDSPDFLHGDAWRYGARFMHQSRVSANDGPATRNDTDTILRWARLPNILLLGALSLMIYFIAREWLGRTPALFALVLAVSCPNLLAHGRYATADVPVTLGFLGVIWGWTRSLARPSPRNLAMTGAFAAILFTSKFSAPLVFPALAFAATLHLFNRAAPEPLPKRFATVAIVAAALLGAAVLVIWASFGFRYAASVPEASGQRPTFALPHSRYAANTDAAWRNVLAKRDAPAKLIAFARDHRLLPESYLYGWIDVVRAAEMRGAFLDGRISNTGFRSYFPLAFLYKTPIGAMALILLGAVALARSPALARHAGFATLVAFIATYVAASLSTHLNIGHRHLLPIYPPLYLIAAVAFVGVSPATWKRGFRIAPIVPAAALFAVAASGLLSWPDYLSYFNPIAGGRMSGYQHLVDSNLDWGHDLKRLGHYMGKQSVRDIYLDYDGSASPAYYGIGSTDLPSVILGGGAPGPGIYAISATRLSAVFAGTLPNLPFINQWTPEHERMYTSALVVLTTVDSLQAGTLSAASLLARNPDWGAYVEADNTIDADAVARAEDARRTLAYLRVLAGLRERPPDARVGASYFVYDLDGADARELLALGASVVVVEERAADR